MASPFPGMDPYLEQFWGGRPTMRAGRTPCCASNGDAQNDQDPVRNAPRSAKTDVRLLRIGACEQAQVALDCRSRGVRIWRNGGFNAPARSFSSAG